MKVLTRRTFLAGTAVACAASGLDNLLPLNRGHEIRGTSIEPVLAAVRPAATPQDAGARETASLDGSWQIVFDRKNEGAAAGWHRQATFESLAGKRTIQVPNCWETIEQDYEGVGWYGRRFRVPASWQNQVVGVRFGAVNYRAEVWINDQPAGFHEAGYTPFVLTIGDLLKPGAENFITVRVIGPILTRDLVIDGIGPNEMPHWRGAIAGGIWQSVELIATNHNFFSDLFVEPDIHSNTAVVHATIVNEGPRNVNAVLQLGLSGTGAITEQQQMLRPGNNVVKFDFHIPNAQFWAPDHPHLYTLEARLVVSGYVVDMVNQRFGMREFTIRENSYYLNDKKIQVKAAFWEGLYPDTLAFPANADVVRREIRLAKEAGFNVLRLWCKPAPPPILDIADEMGLMIIAAPPIECMGYWPQLVPETDQRIATEIRELVLRDRNHPSVIYWTLFNEILRPGIKRLEPSMSILARNLDGSRIVIDQSGGWSGGSSAYLPHHYETEPISDLHSYLPAPVNARTYDFYRHLANPGFDATEMLGYSVMAAPDQLVFVSEMGYGGLPDLPANVRQFDQTGNPLTPAYRYHHSLLVSIQKAMREMQWEDIFGDASALCLASQRVQAEGNKLQIEAIRLNSRVAGYCLHAFTDGDWVLGAGQLDLFRNPKLTYESVKRVQQPLHFAVRLDPVNMRTNAAAQLLINAVNDKDATHGLLKVDVLDFTGKVVFQKKKPVSVSTGVQDVLEMKMPRLAGSGTHRVRVHFQANNGTPSTNELEFCVLANKDLRPPTSRFSVLDPDQELTPFLDSHHVHYDVFSGREAGAPVIVAAETARDEDTFRLFVQLMDYVERGGVAVLLKPPLTREHGMVGKLKSVTGRKPILPNQNSLLQTNLFPLKLPARAAIGDWAPVNHGVRAHPVFEGLPVNDFMGQIYQNVCAAETIDGLNVPPIVGSISYGLPHERFLHNYHGPGNAWWGADMAAVPYGKGQFVLSTLHIQENLETDPVAEKILYNLIRWAQSISSHVPGASPKLQRRIEKFVVAYRSLEKSNP